jgi:hypothetical protein
MFPRHRRSAAVVALEWTVEADSELVVDVVERAVVASVVLEVRLPISSVLPL